MMKCQLLGVHKNIDLIFAYQKPRLVIEQILVRNESS